MKSLTREQVDAFWREGYLMVEDAVTPSQLAALQAEIAGRVEESRAHQKPFGPDVKFHHCKIDLKLSGAKTEVSYPQDFACTPHTNDDIDEDNGCLTVVPGSDRGPMLSLFDGERFTGAVIADAEKQARFARLSEGLVELPKQPKRASFFTVTGRESKQVAE